MRKFLANTAITLLFASCVDVALIGIARACQLSWGEIWDHRAFFAIGFALAIVAFIGLRATVTSSSPDYREK